ncbi:MAG TPA: FAD-binding oxidoreductase [Gemmatimonadaceae bacterium]|nr:FAD-binding oxidoreductase [Gemmatimonadaceae bacterium]
MRPPSFRGIFRDDETARAVYSEGAGISRAIPAAVAVPADGDDLCELVRWAGEMRAALIPRGSGSGMAGGAVGTGVIVDLSRLTTIASVDVETKRVFAGVGATRASINDAARAYGLRFPVDPSSGSFCTIGGMVAANAAGAHSLRYGAMRAWVTALDCVFADGSRAMVRRGGAAPRDVAAVSRFLDDVAPRIRDADWGKLEHRGVRKDSSGYALAAYARSGELIDLLVGSEGTLAIFLAVELALAPIAGATSSLLVSFESLEGAVEGAAMARSLDASACELLDKTFFDVAAEGGSRVVRAGTEAALLVELEADTAGEARSRAELVEQAMRRAGASEVRVALDPVTEAQLWSVRHAASPILARLDPALASMQLIEDGCVPPDRLPDYVRGVRSALEAHRIRGVIFGHAGDAHVHVNPLVDTRAPDWRARVGDMLDEVIHLTARLGGTVTGEHGDGRLRTPLLDRVWPAETIELFRAVKESYDPGGILNPGVKVPLAGQQPIDDVKYDRSLPSLPDVARAALDRVERERAYDRFRLSLVPEHSTD